MKKTLILISMVILLVSVALFTISKYNKVNSSNQIVDSNNQVVDSTKDKNKDKVSSKTDLTVNPGLQDPESIKKKAIDFKLKDLKGNEVSLSDLKGKKVFLNFWATWCPPCKSEMPDIEKLYNETKDSNLVILAVDLGENEKTVKSFIEKNNYNFNILLDSKQEVALKYNIKSIPASYFIDSNGNIVNTHVGAMKLDKMKSYIDKLN